jgi:hypothetical protein
VARRSFLLNRPRNIAASYNEQCGALPQEG